MRSVLFLLALAFVFVGRSQQMASLVHDALPRFFHFYIPTNLHELHSFVYGTAAIRRIPMALHLIFTGYIADLKTVM
jgi:hypothetical protein